MRRWRESLRVFQAFSALYPFGAIQQPLKIALRLEHPYLVENPWFAFLGAPALQSASRPADFKGDVFNLLDESYGADGSLWSFLSRSSLELKGCNNHTFPTLSCIG